MRKISLQNYQYAAPSLAAVLILAGLNALVSPETFLAPANWNSLVMGAMPFILTGMAQTAPVLSGGGGIDLSVGPLTSLVNAIVVVALPLFGMTDPVSVAAAVLAVGAASGLLNGILVAVVRVQPIVATLATYLVYQGVTLQIEPRAGGTAPAWLSLLTSTWRGVPNLLFLLAGIGIAWSLVNATALRRNLLAVGEDPRAAYTAGVDVVFIRITAYVICGVVAALTGLVFTAIMASGDPSIGTPYTLSSIAAVALGGVALAGGRGGMLGPAAAGGMLFLIQNLFTVGHISVFYLQIFYGLILIVALALNAMGGRLRLPV